jgi:hypothetical protein
MYGGMGYAGGMGYGGGMGFGGSGYMQNRVGFGG